MMRLESKIDSDRETIPTVSSVSISAVYMHRLWLIDWWWYLSDPSTDTLAQCSVIHIYLRLHSGRRSRLWRNELAKGHIIHNYWPIRQSAWKLGPPRKRTLFNLLDVIFQAIKPSSKDIILEIKLQQIFSVCRQGEIAVLEPLKIPQRDPSRKSIS